MPSGEAATVGWRLPTRLHSPISIVLVVIIVIGALVPWLGIAQAWMIIGDPDIRPETGLEVSRWLFLAEVLHWVAQSGGASVVMPMAAAFSLIVICGPWSPRDAPLGRRRAILLLALVGMAAAVLAPLFRSLLILYAIVSTPYELAGMNLIAGGGLADVQSLVGLSAEVLAWSVLLLLGVAWWPRGDTALDDDEGGAADGVSGVDMGDGNAGERDVLAEVAPAEEPKDPSGPDQGPRERVDPARLRPDGSSDSGFDEFHFRTSSAVLRNVNCWVGLAA